MSIVCSLLSLLLLSPIHFPPFLNYLTIVLSAHLSLTAFHHILSLITLSHLSSFHLDFLHVCLIFPSFLNSSSLALSLLLSLFSPVSLGSDRNHSSLSSQLGWLALYILSVCACVCVCESGCICLIWAVRLTRSHTQTSKMDLCGIQVWIRLHFKIHLGKVHRHMTLQNIKAYV